MASVRRRSLASPLAPKLPHPDLLSRDEVRDLFRSCIKLASESRISQKKAWELGLIDRLGEIIQEDTNFQLAGCILMASAKIYSLRVDSVHSEAYKVLGRINRAATTMEQPDSVNVTQDLGEDGDAREEEEYINIKDVDKRISPAPTLVSSFEALNVKKFDVAFTVDPLYHQTTAQFDQVPDKYILSDIQEKAELIDLSFAKDSLTEQIEQNKSNKSRRPQNGPTRVWPQNELSSEMLQS